MLRQLLEVLVLPPASALVIFVLGLLIRLRKRALGRLLIGLSFAWLWLASTPFFGGLLLSSLQRHPALPPSGALPEAQAIVCLAAGADRVGAEYGGPVIGPMTLRRLRYAAALQRRTGLPLLVSGGRPTRAAPSLAAMMAQTATVELGVEVRWREERSANTFENLRFSAEQLVPDGVKKVLLVTSAWHMPRAVEAARRFGLEPVPAPTGFREGVFASWRSFVPHWNGLRDTALAMHEWGGRVAYALTP